MERIDPPKDQMAILELRAARAWSARQTADVFQVTAPTLAPGRKRLDEQETDAHLQIPEPVNKFPNSMRQAVQRLKTQRPSSGKVKVFGVLYRVGSPLGKTEAFPHDKAPRFLIRDRDRIFG